MAHTQLVECHTHRHVATVIAGDCVCPDKHESEQCEEQSKAGLRTEEGALGDFDCLTETAHGEMDQAAVALLLRVEEVHQERCNFGAPTVGAVQGNPTRT